MPRKPTVGQVFKMLFSIRDPEAAEGFFFEGMWVAEQGREDEARELFRAAAMLDKRFAGARYNLAALTEKKHGACQETVVAWKDYLACAETDSRQRRDVIERVRGHVADLEGRLARG